MDAGSTVAAKAGADAPGGGISLCFCRRGCAAPAFKAATLNGPRRSIPTFTDPRRISRHALRPLRITRPISRHAHRPSPHHPPRSKTLRSYCKKTETNLSEDILVSIHYVRWSCVRNLLIVRTGGLPPSLRSGRLRPEQQVLQERLALQERSERPCLQELRRLELRERPLQCRRPERVRALFSRRGCRCTSGR